MSLTRNEEIDLMYFGAMEEANAPYLLSEEERRFYHQNDALVETHPHIKYGQRMFLAIVEKMLRFQSEAKAEDRLREELASSKAELASLQTDPTKAFDNYRGLVGKVLSERAAKEAELKSLDARLAAAGQTRSMVPRGSGRAALAVALALMIAAASFYLLFTVWGQKPEAKLDVTYDVAEMVQALLLGSGALIAGVAYAFKTLRERSE